MGVEQTPVFCGEQIGNLILAKPKSEKIEGEYSSDIEMIRDLKIEDLLPKFENIASDLRGLAEIVNKKNVEDSFVANSQDEKIVAINEIVKLIEDELRNLSEISKDIEFTQEKISIEKIPENGTVARKISDTSLAKLLEVKFEKESVTRYREELSTVTTTHKNPYMSFSMDQEVTTRQEKTSVPYKEEFISAMSQLEKYPELAVKVQISQIKKTIPVSAMVICCLPITFGLFVFSYFISTEMKLCMQESWDKKTINMKDIIPIKIYERDNKELLKYIDESFSEYISFIRESIQVRLSNIKLYNERNGTK